MKRLSAALASLVALCVLALGLSACNVGFSPYAAVVNGAEISQPQLREALSAIVNNAGYKCIIESSGTTHLLGAGNGTYSAAFSAEVLSILIQDRVMYQEFARLGLSEPSGLARVVLGQLQAATTPASGCPGTGASILAAFPPTYRNLLLRFQADEDVLSAHLVGITLSPGPLDAYVARHKAVMELACVSVIETSSKATALSLRSQVLGGANFASLAKAHSVDSTTAPQGGAIGCIPDVEFTAPLNNVIAALTVGHVSSPVSFSSNWLLLLVTQRQSETYADVVSSLVALENSAVNTLLPRLIKSAKVQVDPQYGTWDTKVSPARVQANAGPPADIVPNAGANAGPATAS